MTATPQGTEEPGMPEQPEAPAKPYTPYRPSRLASTAATDAPYRPCGSDSPALPRQTARLDAPDCLARLVTLARLDRLDPGLT